MAARQQLTAAGPSQTRRRRLLPFSSRRVPSGAGRAARRVPLERDRSVCACAGAPQCVRAHRLGVCVGEGGTPARGGGTGSQLCRPVYSQVRQVGTQDPEGQLQVWALLEHYDVYTTLNARNQFRAPTEFGLCLRPTEGAAGESCSLGLKCLACESERARLCWVTAMRLAKYGKQLRENYRAFKNKQVESMSPKEYGSYTVPNESVRSRVAMDFTGSVGRIVDDPKEAKAIAVAEGYSWKRRWRPAAQRHHSAASAGAAPARGLEAGVHVAQPWFHGGMSRDHAAQLVGRHGTVDGVFLVRESRSNPGAFVLTFKCGGKVLHSQIQPVVDQVRDAVCYSLDSGVTKFYDLLQLVEFYQLNAGCLPTRLTHYVVQSPTGPLFSEKPMGVFASGF